MPDLTWNINAQVARGNLNQALVASGVTADMSASGINTLTLTPGTNAAGTVAITTATMSSVGLFFARNLSTVTQRPFLLGSCPLGLLCLACL
jgi:hypothetical protein